MIAYYIAQMSHVVRMCPYSNIQMSQVVKCVRHTNDRTNDHTNESLPINSPFSFFSFLFLKDKAKGLLS